MSRIFLIGLPASGKTHWGVAIADHYGWDCYDMDEEIERKESSSIRDIFTKEGEEYFRNKERTILLDLIDQTKETDAVISCGGGTAAMYDNLQVMKKNGCVVYLHVTHDKLKERLKKNNDRPLFNNDEDIELTLNRLLEQRKPFYEQAHYTLDTDDISLQTFEKIIEQCTDRQ